jgi:hypothetical protein
MIECIFTLDYEIYGNGTGSLKELVYEPAERLREIFQKWNARFVNFVEVAEFERIDALGTDADIDLVKRQIRELHRDGFETGLHLHPQWCNASFADGRWTLDYSEYNLCTLPQKRIAEVVGNSLNYLRYVLDDPGFTPLSFRAGNWLFQPTKTAADVLARNGIRVDSSVFKGGLQHSHGLDYRSALGNGDFWSFSSDATKPDPMGHWMEIPIYTEMVRPWRMATSKRMGMGAGLGNTQQPALGKLNRMRDFLRFSYPRKFDFCRMTLDELVAMMNTVIAKDRQDSASFKPIVAIGHTKDFNDPQTVDSFLGFLREKGIRVSTLASAYSQLSGTDRQRASSPASALTVKF